MKKCNQKTCISNKNGFCEFTIPLKVLIPNSKDCPLWADKATNQKLIDEMNISKDFILKKC